MSSVNLVHFLTSRDLDIRNRSIQHFLLAAGGGGRRGILPLEEAVGTIDEASRWFSVTDLAWPGIEIENVCPSLRL
jgi:hypothetical protein